MAPVQTVRETATRLPAPTRAPLPAWALVALGGAVMLVWGAAVWTAGHVHADATLRTAARFVHLAALIVGLGAVLTVDWLAILWLLHRRTLADVLHAAKALHLLVWAGLAGLVLSGVLLHPRLSPLTWAKLGLVLLVAVNGLYAFGIGQRLERFQDRPVPRLLLVQAASATVLSQTGWWGATVVGFLNTYHP